METYSFKICIYKTERYRKIVRLIVRKYPIYLKLQQHLMKLIPKQLNAYFSLQHCVVELFYNVFENWLYSSLFFSMPSMLFYVATMRDHTHYTHPKSHESNLNMLTKKNRLEKIMLHLMQTHLIRQIRLNIERRSDLFFC